MQAGLRLCWSHTPEDRFSHDEAHIFKLRNRKKVNISVTSHINCIVAQCHDERCLSHGMCLYQLIMTLHFLNDVINDIELPPKSTIMAKSLF